MSLRRINELTLKHFRGWGQRAGGEPRRVQFTGDLVLITGANGHGKTSFLEALLLLLAGDRVHAPPTGEAPEPAQLLHRGEDGKPADGWALGFQGTLADETACTGELSWASGGQSAEPQRPADDAWWAYRVAVAGDEQRTSAELLGASLSFFQEDLRRSLDDGVRGQTLRDWFVAVEPALRRLEDALASQVEALRREADALPTRRAELAGRPDGLDEQLAALKGALTELIGAAGAALVDELIGDDGVRRAPLERLIGQVGNGGARPRVEDLGGVLGRLRRALLDRREVEAQGSVEVAQLAAELAEAEQRLKAQAREMAVLGWLGLEDVLGGRAPVPLDEVVTALAAHRTAWLMASQGLVSGPAPDPIVGELVDELQRLDPHRLESLAATLKATVSRAREAQVTHDSLQRRRDELREALARHQTGDVAGRAIEALDTLRARLRQWENQRSEAAQLPSPEAFRDANEGVLALRRVLDGVLSGQSDTAQAKTLETLLDTVLDHTTFRFQPPPGLLPIRPKLEEQDGRKISRLEGADGRSWVDLSTGQKAQLALAWTLAHAVALQGRLPARVLLLDDTSTAFDQGNLARQATWLRQLVYHPDPDQRWQVFLVSHHDELTSRLIELLRPPTDRALQVLKFEGWRPGFGPTVKSSTVRRKTDQPVGDAWAAALSQALETLSEELR